MSMVELTPTQLARRKVFVLQRRADRFLSMAANLRQAAEQMTDAYADALEDQARAEAELQRMENHDENE